MRKETHGELGHPLGVVLAGDALKATTALGALLVAAERVLGAPVLGDDAELLGSEENAERGGQGVFFGRKGVSG